MVEKPRHNKKEWLLFKDKLMRMGLEFSERRHQQLLKQCRCPNCNRFFGNWAAHYFYPRNKPVRCLTCGLVDPLGAVKDPLDNIADLDC